ncbi:hypothetical protein KC19_5G039100 [Ceratodon purpureus]|uniref:NADH-ubiquinone reductase complex 1 MLRQ subunit n=1 Tax=Ceratodon purpureus TaxID=3225 RepID=A0A8T0HZ12_CERPU|nr:hypothetical protein KC19_5G039100 [Ceratodon purpureus]
MCEILPMAAVVGATFFVSRNLSINPDVRINKDDRAAGVLDNYEEGRMYRDHEFRKYLSMQHKTVMPAFNDRLTGILPNTGTEPVKSVKPVEFVESVDSQDSDNLPICP